MDLRLLSKLQDVSTAALVLRRASDDSADYFIITRSVAAGVICSGKCSGQLDRKYLSFNISLSPIIALLSKGYKFDVQYNKGILNFVSKDGKITMTPMYVESSDSALASLVEKSNKFDELIKNTERLKAKRDTLESARVKAHQHYLGLGSTDRGGEGDEVLLKDNSEYKLVMADFDKNINTVRQELESKAERNLGVFRAIAQVAARNHEIVNMCGDYAVTGFAGAYMFQKGTCPVQAIPGQLLYTLIQDSGGKGFYISDDSLVYVSGGNEQTRVFIEKYLPNTEVDSTLITRGHVEEKYTIQLESLLSVIGALHSSFKELELDLGNGVFRLSNNIGEKVCVKFEVKEVNTINMIRAVRDGAPKKNVTISTIKVPTNVQLALSLFRNSLTIYVKSNKIVFQNEGLYLVFGRVS